MKKPITEQQLNQLAKECLEQSEENLDQSVINRLQQARITALQIDRYEHHNYWLSAGALAMAIIVSVIWWRLGELVYRFNNTFTI